VDALNPAACIADQSVDVKRNRPRVPNDGPGGGCAGGAGEAFAGEGEGEGVGDGEGDGVGDAVGVGGEIDCCAGLAFATTAI
jgi:hypothetical protein